MDSRRSSTDSGSVEQRTRLPPRSPSKPEFITQLQPESPSCGAGRGRPRKPRPRDILSGAQDKASNRSFGKAPVSTTRQATRRGADLSPTLPMMPKGSRELIDMDSAKLPSGRLSTEVSLPSVGDVCEKRKMEKTISDLQSEVERLSSKVSEVTADKNTLAQAATCFQSEKAICQTSTETYSKVVIESAKQLGKLHQQIEQLEADIAEKDLEMTEMQEDLDHAAQLTDEYEVLRHDFEELQDAHEKVQAQLEEALQDASHARESERATAEELAAESKRLKADIDQAQGLAAAFMEEHKTLESKHKDITAKASDLEEELQAALEAKDEVSQAYEALSADHEKLQIDADQAVEAAAAIERDLEAQRALAADLKTELEGVQSELKAREETLRAANTSLETTRAQVAQLQDAQKVLEASVADLEQQVATAQSESTAKGAELEALQKRLEKSQREAVEARDAVATKESELADLKGHLEATRLEGESAAAEAAKDAAAAAERESNLSAKVEETEREVGSVRELLASADEALTARDGVVAALKAREATLQEKLDASQVTISEFEEKVASLRKTSDSLQEQLLATEDRVREAAAETVTWKEKADMVDRALTAVQSDLTDVGRERDFLATRLHEREDEVKDLKQQVSTLQAASHRLQVELDGERAEVGKLQAAAVEASGRLTTSLAEACAAVARAEAAEAATSAVEGEKEAAEDEIAVLGDRAEDLAAECSDLNMQCKEAEAFIYEHLHHCWLAATRSLQAAHAADNNSNNNSSNNNNSQGANGGSCERDPLGVLSENAPPEGEASSPLFPPHRPGSGRVSTGGLRTAPGDNAGSKRMSLTSLDGKRRTATTNADTALYSDAWNEFEATAVATANVESSGPEAWRAVAVAVGRLQAEAASMQARRLESTRTMAAQEVAFIKTECSKELATNEKLIEDLSEALDTRGAEAAAARAAHERARQAIAQRDTREARVAAALARADAQTAKLEALCLRTERASGEHVSMLQRSVRDLRSRCESLGEALSEERGALAAVAAKAEGLAARERDARGAETEAAAEATGLAQKLAQVRDEYTCYKSSHAAAKRGVLQRAGGALRSIAVAGAAAAVGVHIGAGRPSLAGK